MEEELKSSEDSPRTAQIVFSLSSGFIRKFSLVTLLLRKFVYTLNSPSLLVSSSHFSQVLRDAQKLSSRMNHRGACACDNDTGDGAGVLSAIPHVLYKNEW